MPRVSATETLRQHCELNKDTDSDGDFADRPQLCDDFEDGQVSNHCQDPTPTDLGPHGRTDLSRDKEGHEVNHGLDTGSGPNYSQLESCQSTFQLTGSVRS